jgi:hypothetical protein
MGDLMIEPKVLLVMSCSQVKLGVTEPTPFFDVYDGPMWKQVKKHWPADRVAVLSAEHGFLPPGARIVPYDRLMDEDRLLAIINDHEQLNAFAELTKQFDKVIVLGGELYKLFSLYITGIMYPELITKVHFACGSYLQQRAVLNQYLTQTSQG